MQEITKTLIESGLSKIETESYLTILQNSPISAGQVAKLTNNYRANTYQAIERLKSKGFVSVIQEKKSKLYEALSPEHILTDLKNKENNLKKIIPVLKTLKTNPTVTSEMRIIHGINGWRNLLNEFLDIGKERVVYGVPKNAIELMGEFFIEHHKQRAKKKAKLKHLFNHDAKDRLKITNKLPFTQSRYLPKELNQPVSTSICGSIIAITTYETENKSNTKNNTTLNKITTIVIDNKTIAKAYKNYFEFLWKLSKNN